MTIKLAAAVISFNRLTFSSLRFGSLRQQHEAWNNWARPNLARSVRIRLALEDFNSAKHSNSPPQKSNKKAIETRRNQGSRYASTTYDHSASELVCWVINSSRTINHIPPINEGSWSVRSAYSWNHACMHIREYSIRKEVSLSQSVSLVSDAYLSPEINQDQSPGRTHAARRPFSPSLILFPLFLLTSWAASSDLARLTRLWDITRFLTSCIFCLVVFFSC